MSSLSIRRYNKKLLLNNLCILNYDQVLNILTKLFNTLYSFLQIENIHVI